MLRPLLLTAATAAAFLRTRTQLRLYLAAELAGTVLRELACRKLGWQSDAYLWLYVATDLLILAAMLNFSGVSLYGLLFAVLASYAGFLARDAPQDLVGGVLLVEGFLYALAGVSVWSREPILSVLWLLLGLFSLGYQAGGWMSLDPLWQSAVCIVAFGMIALRRNED